MLNTKMTSAHSSMLPCGKQGRKGLQLNIRVSNLFKNLVHHRSEVDLIIKFSGMIYIIETNINMH